MVKFIEINLDKPRKLRFGMMALMRIEKKLGKPFSKIDFENELTYEELATVIWGGLVHEDQDLTIERVAELVDEYSDIATVSNAMGDAMKAAFGEVKNG